MASTPRVRLEARELRLNWSALAGGTHGLTVAAGEMLFFCGPSGTGKTSLLRALVAFEPYRSGVLKVDGESLEELGAPTYRQRVLALPQRVPRPEGNLDGFLQQVVADRGGDPLSVRETANRLDLDANPTRACSELSEGEWQRWLLAIGFALAPPVLLLDEPIAPLDPERQALVVGELQRLMAGGTGVIWAAHVRPEGWPDARVLELVDGGLREANS